MSNENQNGGLLFPVAGGLVTSGGAYFASQKVDKVKEWVSEPKWNSFEDIIKDNEAADYFEKEIKGATGDQKTLLEQIKAKTEEVKNAGTNWDTAKEKYIKDNTVLKQTEDTEEIKTLQKQLDDLKASVAANERKYMDEEITKLGKKPAKVKQDINKEKAIKILQTRLFDLKTQEREKELGAERKSKIGTGDRSEKIRTYNYPQNRVTDHRINLTLYKIDQITNEGELDEIIEALIADEQARKLSESDND